MLIVYLQTSARKFEKILMRYIKKYTKMGQKFTSYFVISKIRYNEKKVHLKTGSRAGTTNFLRYNEKFVISKTYCIVIKLLPSNHAEFNRRRKTTKLN